MSSWLVPLVGVAGVFGRPRRWPEEQALRAPCVLHGLFNTVPSRLVAEPGTKELQKRHDLCVVHAVGKSRHDRAALAFDGANARYYDIGSVSGVGAAEGGAEREID